MDIRARSSARVHGDLQAVHAPAHFDVSIGEGLAVVERIVSDRRIEDHEVLHVTPYVEVPITEPIVQDGATDAGGVPQFIAQGHEVEGEHVRGDLHLVAEGVERVEVIDPQSGILQVHHSVHHRPLEVARHGHRAGH